MKIPAFVTRRGLALAAILAATALAGLALGSVQASSHQHRSAAASHSIKLENDHADPTAIAVTVGDYVEFSPADNKAHNIGQGKGDDEVHQADHADEHEHLAGSVESGLFKRGQAYRVQFNTVGTYDFHDHLNPKISVTVIVYARS
jgi:plastocyanin